MLPSGRDQGGEPAMNMQAAGAITYSLRPPHGVFSADQPRCGRFISREILVEADIVEPSLTFWPAPDARPHCPAVIICPGGSYEVVAAEHEGATVARWLNSIGLSAFVLRYRVPAPGHPAPLTDARAAVRLVRSRAAEFGIATDRIGMMGFSAGGHLAGSAGLILEEGGDATTRPDLLFLIYPVATLCESWMHSGSRLALLGASAEEETAQKLSLERCAGPHSPPTFLVHAADDNVVPLENSLRLCSALAKAGCPVELHVYEHGGHGFGLSVSSKPISDWPKRAEAWLRARGWLHSSE